MSSTALDAKEVYAGESSVCVCVSAGWWGSVRALSHNSGYTVPVTAVIGVCVLLRESRIQSKAW